jgi:hypothetical protein
MVLMDRFALAVLMGLTWPLPAQDPLTALNQGFRAAYAQAKADALAGSGPVLVVSGDRLRLFRNGLQVSEAPLRPGLYHRLKAVDHVPLALQLLFGAPERKPTPARVAELRTLALAARDGLKPLFPPADLARQERILDRSLQLLDDALRPGGIPEERLAAFARDLGPPLLANAEAAAGLELAELDRATALLGKGLSARDWNGLKVVIIGSHMAREGEVSQQYFCRLLGEPGEGARIIYAEGLWQDKDALDLLATHLVDLGAGKAFFGDPMRMHRDILADGARKWLDNHPPFR